MSGIRASVVNVKEPETEFSSDEESDTTDDTADCDPNVNIDFSLCEEQKLRVGHYQIVFAHPETLVSSKYGRGLLLSKTYQENVSAIVVDEAHCIVEWLVLIFL
jgi:superfamily II DNA helicase RecQ